MGASVYTKLVTPHHASYMQRHLEPSQRSNCGIVLTHLFPVHPFCTPWKLLYPYGFLKFSGSRKGDIGNKWIKDQLYFAGFRHCILFQTIYAFLREWIVNTKAFESYLCNRFIQLYHLNKTNQMYTLIHLFPMHPFFTRWKQKTLAFFLCFQGIEKGCIGKMGYRNRAPVSCCCNMKNPHLRLNMKKYLKIS